jgi:hypothetical protein
MTVCIHMKSGTETSCAPLAARPPESAAEAADAVLMLSLKLGANLATDTGAATAKVFETSCIDIVICLTASADARL